MTKPHQPFSRLPVPEDEKVQRAERNAAYLLEAVKKHPEIAEKLGDILGSLDNIIGNLDAENAKPRQVADQLTTAAVLMNHVQTNGRMIDTIREDNAVMRLIDTIATSVKNGVEKGRSTKWWGEKQKP